MAENDLADVLHGFTNYVMNERVRCHNEGVDAERKRCYELIRKRAALWNSKARSDERGECAESLADECEDILREIGR